MAEVSIEYPSHLPTAAVMSGAARSLAALPETSEREDVLSTLFKLIDAVIAAPTDMKKRRVKKGNETFHRKVGRHESALQFLRSAGFVDSTDPEMGPVLSMPVAYIVRLTDAHHCLVSAAQLAGLPAPGMPACPVFNPYSASSTSMDSTRQPKVPKAFKDESERIAKELKDKEAALKAKVESSPPVPLKPSVFWSAAGRRLEDVVKETGSVDDSEKGDSAIVGGQLGSVKAAINGSNIKFESADKKALDKLGKKVVHEFCILRVTCPDKSVLEVHFRAADSGEYVLAQVEPLLAPHIREASWYLYQSPPMKKLAGKEKLNKAGFCPGANLYLGFESTTKPPAPYFEATLQATLGAPPQDQGRGVNGIQCPFSGEAMGWGKGNKLGADAAAQRSGAAAAGAPSEAAAAPADATMGAAPADSSAAPAAPAATPLYGGEGQRLGGGSSAAAAPGYATAPASAPMEVDSSAQ